MDPILDKTTLFHSEALAQKQRVKQSLQEVHEALCEKGYNAVGQIVGYLLSGDPTFITSHKGARQVLTQLERDAILEELVTTYLQK